MAWNPAPEVAVARDAANKLKASTAIIVFTTLDGKLGMASYGKTKALCAEAGKCGEMLFTQAQLFHEFK